MADIRFLKWLLETLQKLPPEERFLLHRDLSDTLDDSVGSRGVVAWVSNSIDTWIALYRWETGGEYIITDKEGDVAEIVRLLKKKF